MKSFNYQIESVLYQIFKIISSISYKNMKQQLIILQEEYMLLKQKIELHLNLKQGIISNF